MPARKGDRPFVGLTNEARKKRATARRDAVLLYLRDLNGRISVRRLSIEFGVSYRTMMYDLEHLYDCGYVIEIRSKLIEFSHCTVATESIANDPEPPCDKSNISNFRRGKQLRSGKIHYQNIISHSRSRLSFVEFQVLTVVRKNPGEKPNALYNVYLKECHNPVIRNIFNHALYRLVSLGRVFTKPVSAKRQVYFAYIIPPKTLECMWCSPAPYMTPPRRQTYQNITNFGSYVGKSATRVIEFNNRSKTKLVPIKRFYVEFNRPCECGGTIRKARDGVNYCITCGLTDDTDYIPGIENVASYTTNKNSVFMPVGLTNRQMSGGADKGTPFDHY